MENSEYFRLFVFYGYNNIIQTIEMQLFRNTINMGIQFVMKCQMVNYF